MATVVSFPIVPWESDLCEEAKGHLINYLDALEEYDRIHLMLIGGVRMNDVEAVDGYRRLLHERKFKLNHARELFQKHQSSHGCSEALNFE